MEGVAARVYGSRMKHDRGHALSGGRKYETCSHVRHITSNALSMWEAESVASRSCQHASFRTYAGLTCLFVVLSPNS